LLNLFLFNNVTFITYCNFTFTSISMKNFTPLHFLPLSVNLLVVALLLISSCTSPQHFAFTSAPPAYQKKKAEVAEPALASAETLTAATSTTPVVLPEIAVAAETKKADIQKTAQVITAKAQVTAPKQKLTLAQKVVLKKLQKKVTKINRQSRDIKDTAAGPVSNRSAFALILIGFLAIIFGALLNLGIFYTLGALIVFIALVLLILNYI